MGSPPVALRFALLSKPTRIMFGDGVAPLSPRFLAQGRQLSNDRAPHCHQISWPPIKGLNAFLGAYGRRFLA